jgi:hypothetical protein
VAKGLTNVLSLLWKLSLPRDLEDAQLSDKGE